MAIGNLIPNAFNPMTQASLAPLVGPQFGPCQGEIPAGSLLISDTFVGGPPDLPHGLTVNQAARQQGFKGRVFTNQMALNQELQTAMFPAFSLTDGKLSGAETRARINTYAERAFVGLLKAETQAVQQAIGSGAHHSALNLSQGASKADLVANLYAGAELAWKGETPQIRQGGQTMLGNLAGAFNLDLNKLNSQDPRIAGPERARLQQSLMDHVNKGVDGNQNIKESRKEFSKAVRTFESRHNSVVIAAANHGGILSGLTAANGGHPLKPPADFSRNALDIPEVTSVGATRWFENRQGQLREFNANYSSNSGGIDIYASGSVAGQNPNRQRTMGTSFAAPRVAAAMAQLHKDHPSLSSSQVENLLRQRLTHQLDTPSGSVPVLDYQRTADYLSNGKF